MRIWGPLPPLQAKTLSLHVLSAPMIHVSALITLSNGLIFIQPKP